MNTLRRLVLPALLAGVATLGTSSVAMAGLHSRLPMVQPSRAISGGAQAHGSHASPRSSTHAKSKAPEARNIGMVPR
jgi:hypothetical protein